MIYPSKLITLYFRLETSRDAKIFIKYVENNQRLMLATPYIDDNEFIKYPIYITVYANHSIIFSCLVLLSWCCLVSDTIHVFMTRWVKFLKSQNWLAKKILKTSVKSL